MFLIVNTIFIRWFCFETLFVKYYTRVEFFNFQIWSILYIYIFAQQSIFYHWRYGNSKFTHYSLPLSRTRAIIPKRETCNAIGFRHIIRARAQASQLPVRFFLTLGSSECKWWYSYFMGCNIATIVKVSTRYRQYSFIRELHFIPSRRTQLYTSSSSAQSTERHKFESRLDTGTGTTTWRSER